MYDFLVKCIVVGDSGVGKSCLLLQYTDKRFEPVHDLTIGVEFGSRLVTDRDKVLKLQVWDTAGQECFQSITRSYYRESAVALVVFDVSRAATFQNAKRWIRDVREHCGDATVIMVVGNKCDLRHHREVTEAQGTALARKHNAYYCETSAKSGQNVEAVFEIPAKHIHKEIIDGKPPQSILGVKVGYGLRGGGGRGEDGVTLKKRETGCSSSFGRCC